MAADPVPGAAPDEWHYSHEGVRCEVPVSRARLIGMIRARELDETSSVWCAGWEDWRTVANSEFKEYLREPGSPPPLTGAAVSNSVVWWLAFAPLAGLLIEEVFSGLTGSERGGLWFVTLFLNIGLCHLDEAKLRPLPAHPLPVGEWRHATVYKDYHIELDKLYYSVPYRYIGQTVDVRLGDRTLEIFHDGLRLAVHPRRPENGKASTLPEHRTAAHRSYIERDADSFITRAAAVGGNCAQAVKTILQNFPHPEMAFRSCEGILRLGRQHGAQRLEVACLRCLESGTVRYRHIEQMLSNRMEHIGPPEPDPAPVRHPNLRGAAYYSTITGRAP